MSQAIFLAYPSGIPIVRSAIGTAIDALRDRSPTASVRAWEELDIPGRFIATEVLTKIDTADLLAADISRLNFNVTYEIGYAIGKGKRILIVRNRALAEDSVRPEEVGIFDTIGYEQYSNSDELVAILQRARDLRPIPFEEVRNQSAPIYLVQTPIPTDYDRRIISAIKKSRLYFRSFDPTEATRLPAPDAIRNVAESYGVVLHFISPELVDAMVHNLRSSFVAGLSDGMGRQTAYIQTGTGPIPIDFRDFVKQCEHPGQFKDVIGELAEAVLEEIQGHLPVPSKGHTSLIQTLDLGASAAENEITSLAEYYVEIDAFRRALRKEVRLVTGRKGSGKTAIFFRLRDTIRADRQNVVLDLKPEGYQLLKFKDAVVGLMSIGTVEHTITAFWEYLLWLEICYKLLEKDKELHKRDHRLFELYNRLQAAYQTDAYSSEGDFAERLRVLLRDIVAEVGRRYQGQSGLELTTQQVTELVYRHDFTKIRTLIEEYLTFKGELWLLFDNIDKGWPAQGVGAADLVIIRALLEATRKIERYLQRRQLDAHTVVFLRNDIFEHLIATTADRGKETRSNVDWDDPDLLREMLRRRLSRRIEGLRDDQFSTVWHGVCIPIVDGEDSAQYLIDRCLMRPRSLLDLIGHCRGYAINLGHDRITKEDIQKGVFAFSNDLIVELGLEIRDVFPRAENVLYAFIGAPERMDRDALGKLLSAHGFVGAELETLIHLLLWFGFLGFIWTDGEPRYIYSFHYNMNVLKGFHSQLLSSSGVTYTVNPSFAPALGLLAGSQSLFS